MPTLTQDEQKALCQSGYWVQLLDDMIDINKDRREGIKTLANTFYTKDEYNNLLNQEKNKLYKNIKKLNSPTKNKRQYLFSIHFSSELLKSFYEDNGNKKVNKSKGSFSELLRVLSYTIKAFKNINDFEYNKTIS